MSKIFLILTLSHFALSANILGIWPHAGKSHNILGEVLFKELARRGHNVTMAGAFPLDTPFPNYTDIHLTGLLEDQHAREKDLFMQLRKSGMGSAGKALEMFNSQIEITITHPEMKKLIESGVKFDLVIQDWGINYATLYYAKIFNAPNILISSFGTQYSASQAVGSASPSSVIPTADSLLPDKMTFWQRFTNTLKLTIAKLILEYQLNVQLEMVQKYFNVTTSLPELLETVALVLTNGNIAYQTARPTVPNLIEVGGFHVAKPGKLPQKIQRFMDEAENGVIFFSLGSEIKHALTEYQDVIFKAFGKLPYRIIWKYEVNDTSVVPDNVLLGNWFSQNDILDHPNLKLFISHCGLLSTIEAIHYAVPVLGIPICNDQFRNINNARRNGYAEELKLEDITEESLTRHITNLISNPRYKQNAKIRSDLLKDQPMSPMDRSIYWIEYVLRHKGAKHLQSAGIYLKWYQYELLDVYGTFLGIILLLLTIIILLLRFALRSIWRLFGKLFFGKNTKNSDDKQKKKKA